MRPLNKLGGIYGDIYWRMGLIAGRSLEPYSLIVKEIRIG
jgi:hypothetical protein